MHQRAHNALCSLAVLICLGVTVWSVVVREPALVQANLPVPQATRPSPSETKVESKGKEEAGGAEAQTNTIQGNALIERLIDEGKLSKHPARFYQKVGP